MERNDKVTFSWKTASGRRTSFKTFGQDFKFHAVELMEQEQNEEIFDVWFTCNEITEKLDYYNTL